MCVSAIPAVQASLGIRNSGSPGFARDPQFRQSSLRSGSATPAVQSSLGIRNSGSPGFARDPQLRQSRPDNRDYCLRAHLFMSYHLIKVSCLIRVYTGRKEVVFGLVPSISSTIYISLPSCLSFPIHTHISLSQHLYSHIVERCN